MLAFHCKSSMSRNEVRRRPKSAEVNEPSQRWNNVRSMVLNTPLAVLGFTNPAARQSTISQSPKYARPGRPVTATITASARLS